MTVSAWFITVQQKVLISSARPNWNMEPAPAKRKLGQ